MSANGTDTKAAVAEPPPLSTVELRDWRILDGEGDDLSEDQKKPWTMTVTEGGWGAVLEFTAPDGTVRQVAVELSEGNPRLFLNTGSEENDACVTLCRDHVHVRADRGRPGTFEAVRMGEGGMVPTSDEAEADFTDGDVPAP